MLALTIMTYLLNIFDMMCTMLWRYKFGKTVELNPVGRWLLERIPLLIIVKVFIVGIALIIIYLGTKFRVVRFCLWACFIAYAIVTILHVIILTKI